MDKFEANNWIQTPEWTEADGARSRVVCFRKRLFRENTGASFPIRITAAGRYKLYVNGRLTQFGPLKGDGAKWFVDAFDLAPALREGENLIAVALLCYPMDGEQGNHSLFRFDRPRLYVDGLGTSGWTCRIDRGTAFIREEERFAPLQIHEDAAPKVEMLGWQLMDYDDSAWDAVVPCEADELPAVLRPEKLLPRDIPFMARIPHSFRLPQQIFPAHSGTSFTLDAGEEMCAFLNLSLSGGRGARIELLQSECYVTGHGKADRLDAINGHLEGYTDTYTVAGAENEVYEPYWFRTFRFLKVTIKTADEPLRIEALDYEETGYPLEVKTSVTTSDPSLAPIWDISLRTLRRCMHETYMDCPFYEQLQYIMDTRAQILYTYAVSADDRLARRAIDDFCRAQRPDGLLNCSYPNVNVNVIPGFSMYFILIIHDHMMYFGDKELVRRCLPAIDRALSFFARNLEERGLVGKVGGVNGKAEFWSFIDWAQEWMPTEGMPTAGLDGPITMESLLYLYGLQKAAELADYVGDMHAEEYRAKADSLKNAIREKCRNADGFLTDGPGRPELSQHCQVFGVLTGTLTEEEGWRAIKESLRSRAFAQCSVAMQYYLFRALEQTNLYAETDRCWEIWRRMIRSGCSTCVEAEGYARSECHAWGALALYELPSAMLGVRPAAPGYEEIEVAPQPGLLQSASGTVCTPHGPISVAWTRENGELRTVIDCDPVLMGKIRTKEAK